LIRPKSLHTASGQWAWQNGKEYGECCLQVGAVRQHIAYNEEFSPAAHRSGGSIISHLHAH